jgi:hypothetical protein
MENKVNNSDTQHPEQAPVAASRRSTRLALEGKAVKLRVDKNTSRSYKSFRKEITLPTTRNRSPSPSTLKRELKYRSTTTMPPAKKTKTTTAAVTPAPTTTTPSSKKQRDPNYTELEDQWLCEAWVNVSMNAADGTNRKRKEFYGSIHTMFQELFQKNKHKLPSFVKDVVRDQVSLENRFVKSISPVVMKYNPFYKRVKNSKPSGTTEEDIRKEAADDYTEFYGKAFTLWHVLDILWKAPKYDPQESDEPGELVDLLGDNNSTSSSSGSGSKKLKIEGVNDTLNTMGSKLSRPVGSKAAKAQQTQEKKDDTAIKQMAASHKDIALSMKRTIMLQEQQDLRTKFEFYLKHGQQAAADRVMQQIIKFDEVQSLPGDSTHGSTIDSVSIAATSSEEVIEINDKVVEVQEEETPQQEQI